MEEGRTIRREGGREGRGGEGRSTAIRGEGGEKGEDRAISGCVCSGPE